ncbi:MAG: hypothetical protein JWP88_1396 [Flaviaesturariibacter sp.]|nr:hypothetical protein [Flaviaesturariibacter sp.]
MNGIDILLILIVLLAIWSGWRKGFLIGLFELINWLGSLLAGFYAYTYFAILLQRYIPSIGIWTQPVAFIGTVLLARLLIGALIGRILIAISGRLHRNPVNHALGILPGFVSGVIYAALMAAFLFAVPINEQITENTRKSDVAAKMLAEIDWANEKLTPIFDDAIRYSGKGHAVETKPDETVSLPFKVAKTEAKPDLEAQMLVLVNEERAKAGLKPVVADPELTQVARAHSRDMFARGYFSHYTPEKKDPFDRMKAAHVKFLTAGENLALGQTLSICHRGLMNSPGHRANILQPAFGRLGIGILDGGIYGLMISQEFRN